MPLVIVAEAPGPAGLRAPCGGAHLGALWTLTSENNRPLCAPGHTPALARPPPAAQPPAARPPLALQVSSAAAAVAAYNTSWGYADDKALAASLKKLHVADYSPLQVRWAAARAPPFERRRRRPTAHTLAQSPQTPGSI